jgi:sortase A
MHRLLKWAQRLFVLGGVAALGWCVFVLSDAYIAQRRARQTLASMSGVKTPSSSSTATASRAPSGPVRGEPLAELSIPRLGLSAIVLHGSDAHTLRMGVGHIENTPLPGESGNVAVAGHRDSFFRPLRNVKVGDDILLDTPEERVHYQVSWFRIVNSREVSVISPTREATLTLVTCYPFWFIGEAPDRFVVRATRVENPAAIPRENPAALPKNEENSAAIPKNEGEPTPSLAKTAKSHETRGATDDALAREAVERFRVTYNAGLARHREAGRDELMAFSFCEVAVMGTRADATCKATARSPASLSASRWVFRLDRIAGQWAVTTVGME